MLKLRDGRHPFRALMWASFIAAASPLMGAPLLPDIYMDIRDIAQATQGTVKVIKFSTWTVNIGTGPMELHQHTTQNPDGSYDVDQWIYDSNGTHTVNLAGQFQIVNGRLRFLDSADYFLKEVTAGNGVGGVVASNQKVSYCIIDSQKYNPSGGGPSSAQYTTCGPTMGISVNWADIYPSSFSTQVIPLTGVSDGTYWLENTGDPLNRLIEANDSNNTTRVMVTINTTGLSPEINVTGNSQSIPNNDVTPTMADGTDFGPVDVSTDSLTHTFTVQNTGTGSLSLTGVPKAQVTGSDFTVTTQPASPVAASGGSTTFQIKFAPVAAGARSATVTITNNDSNEGSYQFAIRGDGIPDSDGDGEDDTSEAASGTNPNDPNSVVRTGKALNISTRLNSLTGDNVGIGGFIIAGSASKNIVVRAIGPSLSAFNVANPMQDPTLELHDHTGAVIAFNDDWQQDSQSGQVLSNGLAPSDTRESALFRSLVPGSYTAIIRGSNNSPGGITTGVSLVEVYDVDPGSNSTFTNISTRGFEQTDDNVMIGGIIIGDGLGANGAGSTKVLLRALGPTLSQFNIQNALQDPILELHDGNGALLVTNDNWRDTQETEIAATGMAPPDDRESAILTVLLKGNYTAILYGKNSSTGVALIEAYKVP